ncbi:ferritin-like domain-containing protein [Streptomyces sp. GMY02]|uniref:ferritin-like domain-containing protein n=1 Tax=Streptomyces sp. GMY02 TaxID=1333528 RepID=UPI0020B7CF92|nr:ferritin-like domain-containing protein [Streptomyces sp. GMY02]
MRAEHIDTRLLKERTERSRNMNGDAVRITERVLKDAAADDAAKKDVMALQTAAALEHLAVSVYRTAAGLPFIKNGTKTVAEFIATTVQQHQEHAKAFNAAAVKAGGKEQTRPDEQYGDMVRRTLSSARNPVDVIKLSASLEDMAARTYTKYVGQVHDTRVRRLFASVAPVEAQHRATLLAVQSLLASGHENLVEIPTDAPRLPAALGSAGIPDVFQATANARPMSEGAVL